MNQIQIYHEAPLSIFDKVQAKTDGDYALVHLLEQSAQYAEEFVRLSTSPSRPRRPIILDNSAYELGKAFNVSRFADWVYTLKPDIYVVPDGNGDVDTTLSTFSDWMEQYYDSRLSSKKMGVLAGKTPQEAVDCFNGLKALGADIIGVPFLIGKGFARPGEVVTNVDLMARRASLLGRIESLCEAHPIHLLGVALPQEGRYSKRCPWVVSIDTSNPVIHGLAGIKYGYNGLEDKRSELLADLIYCEVTNGHEQIIFDNIAAFRRFWTRYEDEVY